MEDRELQVHDRITGTDQDTLDQLHRTDAPETSTTSSNNGPPQPSVETPQIGTVLQHWIDRALNFFSHASNETLGACFVGLGASTYLVLGRVGLVLIGVVGGIALHATWEGQSLGHGPGIEGASNEAKKRRELGLEVVQRVWKWREQQMQNQAADSHSINETSEDLAVRIFQGKPLDFSDFKPETAAALDTFTSAVMRDYVKWWYLSVLPGENTFPDSCRQTLTGFLLSLSSHISRKRPTEMFVNFAINSSSIVIAFFAELSAALNASPNSDAATAIDTYIQMKPDSSLARMLDIEAQDKKLGMVGEDILQNFLDPKAYNFPPVHSFLHQILSKLILGMTLDSCSKAEWINGWIVYLLEEGEPEILQAIDAGMENAAENQRGQAAANGATGDIADHSKISDHRRHRSRAEEAMDHALQEAQRLTQMIAEEEAKKTQPQTNTAISSSNVSEENIQPIQTPTSSQSESENMTPISRYEAESRPSAMVPQQPEKTGSNAPHMEGPPTTFDQLLPSITPSSTNDEPRPVLTLHNAKISIFDDSMPGEKNAMKSKPTIDYLVQIEPLDSRFPGWMIARKYTDFEVLHEVLRRISVITGVRFTESHATLPHWKTLSKPSFALELERYLTDAVKYQPLAESEGLKRFLEKDQGLSKSSAPGKGLGWPDPLQMGKGMMDVLTKAPREVTSGGKALFGGVTSVLSGGKRSTVVSPVSGLGASTSSLSLANSSPPLERSSSDVMQRPFGNNGSQESLQRKSSLSQTPIYESTSRPSVSSRTSFTSRPSVEVNPAMSSTSSLSRPESASQVLDVPNLPPPPSAFDEYEIRNGSPSSMASRASIEKTANELVKNLDTTVNDLTKSAADTPAKPSAMPKAQTPMTEQETIVTVDLFFAVISELYTLSSAWTFRRTLLQAARTFLLRPGNPQLEAIRVLIQESVIDANSSDAGIAKMILKTRESSLPTEEELKQWPKPLEEAEKQQLRIKARKLLVERGMPQALTSVMGAAASGEALGKVFDCLQLEKVARSMMFGLMLQGLRAAVQ